MKRLSLLFLSLALAVSANAASISITNATGNIGGSVTSTVSLVSGTDAVAGTQFDLVYDKTALTITAKVTGTAVDAEKSVATSNPSSTNLRVLLFGISNNTAILDGQIITLTIKINAAATNNTNYPVTLAGLSATDPDAKSLTLTGTGFNVAVGNPPQPQTITFGALGNKTFGDAAFNVSATASSGLTVTFDSGTPSVCTVSGTLVALVGAGTCTINANQAGNTGFSAATAVSQSFTVAQAQQVISFTQPADTPLNLGPVTLTATASSALPVTFVSTTAAVCTVSGASVTLASKGTCSITASQAGNTNFAAAAAVTRTFNVTGAVNTITFNQPANTELFAGPVNLSATASSGLTVSFASNSAAICTVAGAAVTLVTPGTCSITATQAGDATWAAATAVTKTFTVLKGSQTITFNALSSAALGTTPPALTATASSNLAVTFSSNSAAFCTVAGNQITLVSVGTCSISANQAGDASYAAAPAVTQTFAVTQGSQTITFHPPADTTFGTTAFSVSATASSGLAVSFASTTSGVCTVAGTTVTLTGVGTCSLTASQAGNSNYLAATPVSQSFTVNKGSQTITFGTLSGVALGAAPFTISATSTSGLGVSFVSTTTKVCTVTGSTVTILDVGVCSIDAIQAGNTNYLPATTVTQAFNVAAGSQTISFGTLSNVSFGASPITLTATASSNLTVTFASTTTSVCTVTGNVVTLVGAGTCSITASQAGNASYAAATDVIRTFTVAKGSQTISFAQPASPAAGTTAALTATATSGLAVTFSSSTTSICTVSGTTLSALKTGACTITAAQAGDSNYLAATSVTQTFNVAAGTQTITFHPLSNLTFGAAAFTVSATSSSGLAVTFASATPTICTVSGASVTIVGAGTCTITASQGGDVNFAAATPVSQSFTVAQASQTITFNTLSNVPLNTAPFTVSATTSSNLAVTFASTTTSVCTVAGNTVTLVSVGACSLTASQAGNANYTAATTVTQGFTVGKGTQTITFGTLSNVTFGSAPLNLAATASSALAVTYTSTTTPVCTVSGSAVTIVDVGTCSITASQAGDANWSPATDVVRSFTVGKGAQSITFTAPAGAAFGDAPFALAASASSNLPITFVSTTMTVCTVAGNTVTIVTAGSCSITASQAGNTQFNPATDVVRSFTVTKAAQTITFAQPSDVIFGVAPFAVTTTASSSLAVVLSTTTTTVCTLSGTTVTVVGTGTCSIKANQPGDASYLAANEVLRAFTVAKSPQTITFGTLPTVAFGVSPITLTASASSGLTIAYTSTTQLVCTVSGAVLTIVAPGNCSVTANQAGNANYLAATAVTQGFIATGTQTINFPPLPNLAIGTPPFQLGATVNSGLPVSYASTTTGVCTVSGNTVTMIAQGTCSLTATQTGSSIFLAATPATQSFTVLAPPPCEYKLTPASASFSPGAASGTFTVQTASGCKWTASTADSFITLTSPTSGDGSADISFTVSANGGSRRSGSISVGGQTFAVSQFAASCSFALDPASLDFTAAGGTGTVSIYAPVANCSWTGTAGDPAVTLSPSGSTAPSQFTVTVGANPNTTSRTLTATVGGQTLTLNQAGKNCTVTLGDAGAAIPAAGGFGSVVVTTQAGCNYSTVNGPNWITVTSGGSGSGPGGTLFYSIAANSTTQPRTGTMSVGGQPYTITQPGVTCELSLDTSTLGSPFASAGGTGTVGILTNNPGCSWNASTQAGWLTITGASSGTGAGTVSLTAAANPALTQRTATVNISGQLVYVAQAGTTCSYSLRSSGGSAPSSGGTGSVGVVAATGCNWTSATTDSWLSIGASANTGTGDVQFTATANTGAAARTGTITIAGQTYTVTQAGAPCAFTLSSASVNVGNSGGNGSLPFNTTATGCTASAVSYSSWLGATTTFSGQAGSVNYTAAGNSGAARTALVKLADTSFSVNQAAASCSFTLGSAGKVFGRAGGTGTIQVTAASGACTPSITSSTGFATFGTTTGPVSGVYSFPYTVPAFISATASTRSVKITVGGFSYTIKQTSW